MKKNNKYQIAILRPGGNDQLIIKGIVEKSNRREINDLMIRQFPNVEQVSFYEFDKVNNITRLELAGGEFCGNATRSLAYLLLNGEPGKLLINVSGTKQALVAGVKRSSTAFAQMPVSKSTVVKKLSNDLFRVDLEGITHLIYTKPTFNKTREELKKIANQVLKKQNLLFSVPAAGVMFIEKGNKQILLKPVVWVRDIETLLYETSCASGTAAVGLWLSLQKNKNVLKQKVKQPTGNIMEVIIRKNKKQFIYAEIDGPIKVLKKGDVLC